MPGVYEDIQWSGDSMMQTLQTIGDNLVQDWNASSMLMKLVVIIVILLVISNFLNRR